MVCVTKSSNLTLSAFPSEGPFTPIIRVSWVAQRVRLMVASALAAHCSRNPGPAFPGVPVCPLCSCMAVRLCSCSGPAAEVCAATCILTCHPGARPGLLGSLCLTRNSLGTGPTAPASHLRSHVFAQQVFVS